MYPGLQEYVAIASIIGNGSVNTNPLSGLDSGSHEFAKQNNRNQLI